MSLQKENREIDEKKINDKRATKSVMDKLYKKRLGAEERGFSTFYEAILLDGPIQWWDNKTQTWIRYSGIFLYSNDYEIAKEKDVKSPLNYNKDKNHGARIVLKSLNNSSSINDDFLNELWD
ncbi:19635_t:CDS:2 [Rhizophagus irregularis]|nr:19635_t:CDS:2 [Rhizophagus irregularis]